LGEHWLGNLKNDFQGSKGKILECFKNSGSVRVIAFQASTLEDVLNIKDRVRNIFEIGKHSIHITDTASEAVRVARLVFNDNCIHFLNHARPNKYLSTHQKLDKFKEFLFENNLRFDDVILDTGSVVSVYGLRETADTDFFIDDNSKVVHHYKEIDCHDEELTHHKIDKLELIYNPKFYFYYNDLKFVSFDQLFSMKRNRGELKDDNDCEMMLALVDRKVLRKAVGQFKQSIYYGKIKCRAKLITLMKGLGIYQFAKKLYKAVTK
jgi:hypothetical protein